MADSVLTVNHLSIALDGSLPIVNDLNFSLGAGETLALVGESGSGKTMTALSILQLLPSVMHVQPNSEILLERQNLLELPEFEMRKIRGCRIGMIFQEPMTSLNPVFTIGEQISEVLHCHNNIDHHEAKERVVHLLSAVGLTHPEQCYNQYPHQLSGGMQQRAMIAMAVSTEPRLLIADEPTSSLDVTIQAQVLKLLKKIQEKMGMAILLITHDLGVVKATSDAVAVMYRGEIIEHAPAAQFFKHSEKNYSKKLFEALPSYEKRGKPLIEAGNLNGNLIKPMENEITASVSISTKPLLTVSNLEIFFPIRKGLLKRTVGMVRAVDGIDLKIYPGKTLALIGESGSGKTTAGKGILQLLDITSGSILFNGQELTQLKGTSLRHVRENIQMIFQDPFSSLNPRMQILDIVAEGIDTLNLVKSRAERKQRVELLLQQVGLDPAYIYRYPHEFSGGQRQRLSIARALAVNPKLIICDEPTSALDVSVQAQILNLLRKLQQELGIAYLFITHNMAVVAYLADEVAVMHEGKIVEQALVENILNHPQHPYTKFLLSSVLTV